MLRLSEFQSQLPPFGGSNRSFEHTDLVKLLADLGGLFRMDEDRAILTFMGTPGQFAAVLNSLLQIARMCGVNMESAIWAKYPNICPYCLSCPCICGRTKTAPHTRLIVPLPKKGLSFAEMQKMFEEIYPPSTSSPLLQFRKTAEEIAEVSWEIFTQRSKKAIEEEFADVFARLAGLASIIGIPLAGLEQPTS
ncbi:hypothetical protein KKI17_00435 [Patescibacteria group bacterium]|nr:hypothetical protein [Patescibacteria group bacterium]